MKLSDFNLLDENQDAEDFNEVIESFNQTDAEFPDQPLHRLFSQQALKTPEAVAAIDSEVTITYAELDKRSNQLARFLLEQDVEKESYVAIMLDRSVQMVIALLGILKSGAAYFPLNRNLPIQRTLHMVMETRASILISNSENLSIIKQLKNECPTLKKFICLENEQTNREKHTNSKDKLRPDDLFQYFSRDIDAFSYEAVESQSNAGNLCYVIFTSGTTGKPKGVMVEHRGVVRLLMNSSFIQVKNSDRLLQTGSLAFDASTFEIWGMLLHGGAIYFPLENELLDLNKLEKAINRHNISIMFVTVSLFNLIATTSISVFANLRMLMTGGEKVSSKYMNKVITSYPNLELKNCYGPTENTSVTTVFHLTKPLAGDIPIGKPVSNTTTYVLDNQLQPLPVGVPGELYTGGAGVARGYLGDEELSRKKFIPSPFRSGERLYKTGDRVRWLSDGNLEFIDRVDNQVKIRGYRIELGEIETQLSKLKGVEQAVVVARELVEGREILGYVIGDNTLNSYSLLAELKSLLPTYMIPRAILVVNQFPLTPIGKIDKDALPVPPQIPRDNQEHLPLKLDTEKQLAQIWEEVLDHKNIHADDNFFDLGGHSLRATKLLSLIHSKMGVDLPLSAIFNSSTLQELSQKILDNVTYGSEYGDESLILLNYVARPDTDTAIKKIFAMPPGTGDVLGYLPLAELLKPYQFYAFNFIESESHLCEYADQILAIQPDGPYCLFGYSSGGNLAYHVAGELEGRGKNVSMLMVDSSRKMAPFKFDPNEVKQVTKQFLDHETIKPYITRPWIREKAARKIKKYYQYIETSVDAHKVSADIHVIHSEKSDANYIDTDGTEIMNLNAWKDVSVNGYFSYTGKGRHNDMLYAPALEFNTKIIKDILNQIFDA